MSQLYMSGRAGFPGRDREFLVWGEAKHGDKVSRVRRSRAREI